MNLPKSNTYNNNNSYHIRQLIYWLLLVGILIIYAILSQWHHLRKYRWHVPPETIIANYTGFEFGLATAPAHVEDNLNDTWVDWGRRDMIPFFLDQPRPESRLLFWTRPEDEINLAAESGVTSIRIGVDWGRLVPRLPGSLSCSGGTDGGSLSPRGWSPCSAGIQDNAAMLRYIRIISMARDRGMRVILTLFHHSLPVWASSKEFGGWTNPDLVDYFVKFGADVVSRVSHLVDVYVTFNEPAVFANLVYALNMWPGRLSDKLNLWAYFNAGSFKGSVVKCYNNMALAHNTLYSLIKKIDRSVADDKWGFYGLERQPAFVTIAHNVAWYVSGPPQVVSGPVASFLNSIMNFAFMDLIQDNLDLIGINYYGQEIITTKGAALVNYAEYSESGRAISTVGFRQIIDAIHDRYNVKLNRSLPILITENGISDETDVLRPSYMIEHLMVVEQAISDGIPIRGYHWWTISDNFEWADGYCPKFGLIAVDRNSESFQRWPRKSFLLFRDIVKTNSITLRQRVESWDLVKSNSGLRPFCRDPDGKGTVRHLAYRYFSRIDWRFPYKLELFPRIWPF